jgi:hypothetical protein
MLGSLIQQLRVDLAAFRASSKMAGVGTLSANRLRPSRRQLESKPEASKEAPTAAIATKLCRLGAKSGAVFLYLATLSRTRSVPGSSSYVTTPRTNQATKSPPTIITVLNHRLIAMRRESCLRRCRSIYIYTKAGCLNQRTPDRSLAPSSTAPRCRRRDVPILIKSDGGTIAGILREWGSDGSHSERADGGHAVLDERPPPERRRGQIKTTNLRKQHQADLASKRQR